MNGTFEQIRVRISQMGSRERYAMARALQQSQMLELFCTDLWNPFGEKLKKIAGWFDSKTLDKIAYNFHSELPPEKIRSFNFLGIKARLSYRSASRKSSYQLHKKWIQFGKAFAHAVNNVPKGDHNVFLGYSTACLESLEYEKRLGNFAIVNQVEPGKLDNTLVCEEEQRWPGWSRRTENTDLEEYYQRLEAEWRMADLVIVNSNYSKSTLLAQGVPEEKIEVVPLPLPEDEVLTTSKDRWFERGVLNVLCVAGVSLRKGIPYLIEAAKLLQNDPVKFTVVGQIAICKEPLKTLPSNVEFIGMMPYARLRKFYAGSDVFLLPTISDGFARVQLEAMASGLPVITTPNCGEVVTHGEDGFIVPIRDPWAIMRVIRHFLDDRQLVQVMSAKAQEKVKSFSLEAYGDHLRQIVEKLVTK